MEKKVRLTRAVFYRGLSDKRMLRPVQFKALGYKGPFKGWKKKLVGSYFTQEQIDEYVRLRKGGERDWCQKSEKKSDSYYDPEWAKLAKKIIIRDGNKCVCCGVSKYDGVKLNVHHMLYESNKEIWDVPEWYLVTLCSACHKKEHSKYLVAPKKHF